MRSLLEVNKKVIFKFETLQTSTNLINKRSGVVLICYRLTLGFWSVLAHHLGVVRDTRVHLGVYPHIGKPAHEEKGMDVSGGG